MGVTCEEAENYAHARKCRFCQEEIKKSYNHPKKAFHDCCGQPECVAEIDCSCDKIHRCGHVCKGWRGEHQCLPCLEPDCITKYNEGKSKQEALLEGQNSDEFCTICYTTGLG